MALAFAVKVAVAGSESKFLVYRDRKEIASVNPRSALDGLGGTYGETVRLWEQHRYQVCFLSERSDGQGLQRHRRRPCAQHRGSAQAAD